MKYTKIALGAVMLLSVALAIAACGQRVNQHGVETIKNLREKYVAALNGGDPDLYVALWTEEGVLTLSDPPDATGKDAIRSWFQNTFDQFTGTAIFSSEDGEMLSRIDWLIDHGTYALTLTPKNGGEPIQENGKYALLWTHQSDNSWKLLRANLKVPFSVPLSPERIRLFPDSGQQKFEPGLVGKPTDLQIGTVRVNPIDKLEYVWLPGASFQMGCVSGDSECDSSEKPQHRVTITKSFWMSRIEITAGAYRRFAIATFRELPPPPPFNPGWRLENHPITNVLWDDAAQFCKWAGGRLSTEAEWEYAARGGKIGWKYPWGHKISHEQTNYKGIGDRDKWEFTSPVGSFAPNEFGLYDFTGNVWEWVADGYDRDYYSRSPTLNPLGGDSTSIRVIRGGSYSDDPRDVRISARKVSITFPPVKVPILGFRCVQDQ